MAHISIQVNAIFKLSFGGIIIYLSCLHNNLIATIDFFDDALKDLGKTKAVLVKKTFAANAVFEAKQHNNVNKMNTFEAFLRSYSAWYDLFVLFQLNAHGGHNIGDVVRFVLKKLY